MGSALRRHGATQPMLDRTLRAYSCVGVSIPLTRRRSPAKALAAVGEERRDKRNCLAELVPGMFTDFPEGFPSRIY